MVYKKFVQGIVGNSQSSVYKKALSECVFHHKEIHQGNRKQKCVCTKEKLKKVWFYQNKYNDKIIQIGSKCIKNFFPKEFELYQNDPYYETNIPTFIDIESRIPVTNDLYRERKSGYHSDDDFVVSDDEIEYMSGSEDRSESESEDRSESESEDGSECESKSERVDKNWSESKYSENNKLGLNNNNNKFKLNNKNKFEFNNNNNNNNNNKYELNNNKKYELNNNKKYELNNKFKSIINKRKYEELNIQQNKRMCCAFFQIIFGNS